MSKVNDFLTETGSFFLATVDGDLEEAVLDGAPYLRSIYNPETGHHLKLFVLEEATAVDIPMMGPGEDLLN